MTRNIVKALDITVEAIADNKTVPSEAVDLFSKSIIPNWLYTLAGNFGWKGQAKKFNAHKKLYIKPYTE